MADRRSFQLDLLAGGLLVAGLLAALSVFSYEPADPPAVAVYPANPEPANILGEPAAWLADRLFATLGVAVYVLLASWFVLVVMLFLRRSRLTWLLRLAGWLLLLPSAAVAADRVGPGVLGGPLTGSGGTVGAWLTDWLKSRFEPAGRYIITGACLLLGLALTVDFALMYLLRWIGRVGRWGLSVRRLFRRSQPIEAFPDSPPEPARSARRESSARRGSPDPADSSAGHESLEPAEEDGEQADEGSDIPISHPEIPTFTEEAETAAPDLLPIVRPAAPEEDRFAGFELPPLSLLEDPQPFPYEEHDQRLRERAALLEKTFTDFGLNVRVVGINTGPVITQYEVALETGLRLNKVTRLADDIALNLKVASVRMVAPIPGKNTVGVELPNEHRAVVRIKDVILGAAKKTAKSKIPLFLGKDTEGRPLVYDLAEMPHLLIAGRTGTGKSVCLNSIILSILMTRRPDEVKMVMIDPKMTELIEYGKIPHLMHPVVKDTKKAEAILSWAVDKMEERYDLLSRARVRNIGVYNELPLSEIHRRLGPLDEEERQRVPEKMPYIVIFVDEFGDLIMQMKREVEGHIIRLAQKSRAAGIHLVLATQKPTVDIITGLIKSNLPARICFQVSSRSDSRVVLDEMGADKLLGKGDMLFLQPGTSTLIRSQGAYASDEEITRVVDYLECEPCYDEELVRLKTDKDGDGGSFLAKLRERDPVYEQAIEIVVREGRGSVSLLQRALGIGYGRAARLIDFMAEDGIVGAYNGSNAREVLFTPEQWDNLKQGGQAAESA
jgi:S-DNA-T family DNA segregation ATPase FtsK/SpoIIIE